MSHKFSVHLMAKDLSSQLLTEMPITLITLIAVMTIGFGGSLLKYTGKVNRGRAL